MNNDCSILVLSCDNNIDVLRIFLDNFRVYRNGLSFKTYICLEEHEIVVDGVEILLSKEKTWAKRIKNYLACVDTKYVMFILDDFLIEKEITITEIYNYLDLMQSDEKIARITLTNLYDKKSSASEYLNLRKQNNLSNYLVNMQVSIWNKNIFYSLLRDKETPWQTELYGSIRARKLKKFDFLYLYKEELMPIKYNRGWLIVRGKWNKCEIDRLHLLDTYSQEYFINREIEAIQYTIKEASFLFRVRRRISIMFRQFLSCFKIYM